MESQKDSHRIRVLLDEQTIAKRVHELAAQILSLIHISEPTRPY